MKRIYCILISGLVFISSYAQPGSEEVSHYLFPEFIKGVILTRAGEENGVLANYNSLTEEMVFENKGNKLAIAPGELARIDTVYIKDRKFIVLNHKFVEFLYHSKWDLYLEHKCKLREKGEQIGYGATSKNTSVSHYSSLFSQGVVYELKLPDGYETKLYSYYWLKKNGELYKFENMKDLKKLYTEKEDLFKSYVKKHRIKYKNQESIIQLIEYLESN
ncbi:MAG: hypothetical protein GY790_19390 [Bacteroidetes bacterium]|nr:hypothetical protein [Bacteroidota bacterium]